MLIDTVENWLEVSLTPEACHLFTQVIELLENAEDDSSIQDLIIDIIYSTVGDEEDKYAKPDNMILDEVRELLNTKMTDMMLQFGVTPVDKAPMQGVYDFLMGMSHLSDMEDVSNILAIAGSEDDALGKLCDILHHVTTIDSCHWEEVIEEVSPDLIKKISQLGLRTVSEAYLDEGDDKEIYLKNIRIYAAFLKLRETHLATFDLVGSVMLGGLMETYINSGVINDLFDGNEMDRLAMELYGMALISSDGRQDPVNTIRTIVDKYLSDVSRIVKLNAVVGKLSGEFIKFHQVALSQMKDGNE